MADHWRSTLLLFLAGFCLTSSAPIDSHRCDIVADCKAVLGVTIPKFNYKVGHIYEYRYKSDIVTSLPGTTDETSHVKVSYDVKYLVKSDCEGDALYTNVFIEGPTGEKYPVSDLEGHAIRMGLDSHGHIAICAAPTISASSLNIVRGSISLTNIMLPSLNTPVRKTVQERDSFGNCPTDYTLEKSGNRVTVHKHKNLNQCSERQGARTIIDAVPYKSESKIQNIPSFESSVDIHIHLKDGIEQSIEAHEINRLHRFSLHGKGAQTEINSVVTLVGETEGTINTAEATVEYDVIFDHNIGPTIVTIPQAVRHLKELCKSTEKIAKYEAAEEFHHLVTDLRGLTRNQLKGIYRKVQGGEFCPQSHELEHILFHALIVAETPDSVGFVSELIAAGGHEKHERLWYTVLAFVKNPKPSTLADVYQLIDKADVSKKALLGVSGLAHQLCRSDDHCADYKEYVTLVNRIGQHLPANCKTTSHEDENKVLSVLKALGNLDHLTNEVAEKIQQCVETKALTWRVRFAAFEAFRRDSCRDELKKSVRHILEDLEEETEVRIEAYRSLVRCPTEEDALAIKNVLEHHEINQVESYISSHIHAVHESDSPLDKHIHDILHDVHENKHGRYDPRRFSYHFARDRYLERLNLGYDIQADIVFSTKTYVPKFVAINATALVFGKAVNFLEVGATMEGLEHSIESAFGPHGYFQNKDFYEVVNDGREAVQRLRGQRTRRSPRQKREVPESEINALAEKIHLEETFDKEPQVDLYLRIFGTEVNWFDVDHEDHNTADDILSKLDNVVKKAKNAEVDFTLPVFADFTLQFPTSSGLPLTLDVVASSVVSLQAKSHIDLPKVLKDILHSDFSALFVPSISTEIGFTQGVSTPWVTAGLEVRGNIHSASGVNIVMDSLEGKGFDFKLEFPLEDVRVFEVGNTLAWVHHDKNNDQETPVTISSHLDSAEFDEKCSTAVLGLQLCGEASYPKINLDQAMFPLSGPAHLKLHIKKENPELKGIHLRAFVDKSDGNKKIEILLETPGSNKERKFSFNYDHADGKCEGKLQIVSPIKNFHAESSFVSNDNSLGFQSSMSVEGREYSYKALFDVDKQQKKYTYTPVVEYSTPNKQNVQLVTGKITHIKGKKLELNLKSGSGVQSFEATLKGVITTDVEGNNYKYTVKDLKWDSTNYHVGLDGFVSKDAPHTFSTQFQVTHGAAANTWAFNGHYENLSEGDTYHYKVNGETQCSVHPNAGVTFKKEVKYQRGEKRVYDSDTSITFGGTRVVYERSSHLDFNGLRDFLAKHSLKLTIPKYELNYDSQHELEIRPKNLRHEMTLHYGDGKQVTSHLTYKRGDNSIYDHEINAKVSCPDHTYELTDTRVTSEPGHVKHDWKLVATPGNTHELNVEYKLNRLDDGYNFDGEANYQRSNSPHPTHLKVHANRDSTQRKAEVQLDFYGENKVKGSFELNRNAPGDVTIETHLFVKKFLEINEKAEYKRPNFHSNVEIYLPRYERRIKREVDIKWADHKGLLTYDLKWDADRDASKHIHGTGNINLGNSVFNAPHSLQLEAQLPSGTLKIDAEAEYTNTDDKKGLRLKTSVVEPDGDTHSTDINTLATDIDLKTRSINRVSDIVLKCNGKEVLNYHSTLKHNIDSAGKHNLDLVIKATGEAVPSGLDITLHGNRKEDGQFKLDGNYKRGSRVATLASTGHIDLKSHKKLLHVDADVTLPFENLKTLKVDAKYTREDYEIQVAHSISWNGRSPFTGDVTIKLDPEQHTLNLDVKGNVPDKAPSALKFQVQHIREKRELDIEFDLDFRGQRKVKVDVGASRVNRVAHFIVEIDRRGAHLVNPKFEQLKLVAELRRPDDHTKLTKASFELDTNQIFELDKKVTYGEEHCTLEINYHGPKGSTAKVTGQLDKRGENEYTAQGHAEINGKTISGEGDIRIGGLDDFDVKGSIDGPSFGVEKVQVKVSRKVTGKRRKVAIDIRNNNNLLLGVSTDFSKKEDRSGVTYQGTVTLEHSGDKKMVGDFTIQRLRKEKKRDHEEGRQMLIEASIAIDGVAVPLKINVDLKNTNREKRIFVSYHPEDDSWEVDLALRDEDPDSNDMHYIAIAYVKHTAEGKTRTRGLLETLRWDNTGLHREGRLYLNKEKDLFVGHDTVISRGKELSFTVYLFDHTPYIGVKRTVEPNGARHGEFAIATDIKHHPDDKLSVTWSLDPKSPGNFDFNAVLKHAALPREYTVKGTIKKGEDSLTYKLDADLFAKKSNKLVLSGDIQRINSAHGRNYTFELSGKSKGLNIDIDYVSNTYFGVDGFFRQSTIDYLNHAGEKRQLSYDLGFGHGRAGIIIHGFTGKTYVLQSTWNRETINGHRGIHVETNVEFPGLKPLVVIREFTLAPSYKMKLYLKENENRYLEFFGGYFNDDHVGFGVHRHLEGETEELVDFSVGFDDKLHLYGKTVFNKENIFAAIDRATERSQRIRTAIREAVDEVRDLVVAHIKARATTLKQALPDFKPVLTQGKEHIKRLRADIRAGPNFDEIQEILDEVEPFIGEDGEGLSDFYNHAWEQLVEDAHIFVEIAKEEFQEFRQKIQAFRERLREKLPKIAKEITERISDLVDRIRERIKPRFDKIKAKVNKYLDEHPELRQKILDIKEKVTDLRLRIYGRIEKVLDALHELCENIREKIYDSKIRQIILNIRKHIREEHKEELEYVKERLLALFDKLEARADELYISPRLRSIIKRVLQHFEQRVRSYGGDNSIIKSFIHDSTHTIRDLLDILFLIDFDRSDLHLIPSLPIPSVTDIAERIRDNLIYRLRDRKYNRPYTESPSLLDRYFRLKSALFNPREILPPFKSFGAIIDSKYYVTFDGKALVLDGHCPYLLAADFVDRNFTLVVRYENPGKTMVFADSKNYVEIGPDAITTHKVLVDDKTVSLPATAGEISVIQSDRGVAAKSSVGVTVACSAKADVCIVELNGFYYGKSMGILGTNNHESYDDVVQPDGHQASSASEFAAIWKVGKRCSAQATEIEILEEPHDDEVLPGTCNDLFTKWTSSLRPCFSLLNRRPYAAICKKQEAAGQDVHSSAVAYAAACKVLKGLHVNV